MACRSRDPRARRRRRWRSSYRREARRHSRGRRGASRRRRPTDEARLRGELSTTFAANRGLDEVIVRAGRFAIDPADYPAGKKPNPFGKPIEFQRDFVYKGGDLLLEIGATALTSGRNVDNVSPLPSKEGQSVYGNGFSAAVATGTPFFDLIVVEFTFEYP